MTRLKKAQKLRIVRSTECNVRCLMVPSTGQDSRRPPRLPWGYQVLQDAQWQVQLLPPCFWGLLFGPHALLPSGLHVRLGHTVLQARPPLPLRQGCIHAANVSKLVEPALSYLKNWTWGLAGASLGFGGTLEHVTADRGTSCNNRICFYFVFHPCFRLVTLYLWCDCLVQ